jgi:hypothetical protein
MRKGKLEILAETDLNWQEEVGTAMGRLRVERDPSGEWKVFISAEKPEPGFAETPVPGSVDWKLIGSGIDTLEISPAHFGIYYRFSSRQDRKLWLDDLSIQGRFVRDTIPPSIARLMTLDEHTLQVEFSEPLDIASAINEARYSISDGSKQPDTLFFQTSGRMVLVFKDPFESGTTDTLRIFGIKDPKDNVADILKEEFTWFRAGKGDILINEIMYDPEPQVRLPGYEYIELYNRSAYPVEMEGWIISTGTRSARLPQHEFPAEAYMLICYKESSEQYPEAGLVLDALTSKTFFSNQGSLISLFDREGVLIDWIEYSTEMHADEYYASGGWSLERIDPERECHADDNWTSSSDRQGGSPGRENSVRRKNPDRNAPEIVRVYSSDPGNLHLEFNETMDGSSLCHSSEWKLELSSGHGGEEWIYPDTIKLNYPFMRKMSLHYSVAFEAGRDYYLEPGSGIRDCSGNSMQPGSRYRFAIPVFPGRSDILITEVLFNPMPFCPDFVEIYNPGPAVFDLADIGIAGRDPETARMVSATRIIPEHFLFYPGEYRVLTADPESLAGCHTIHDPDVLVKVSDMPGMKDDVGSVLIIDKYLEVIDEFGYNERMHHPGLSSEEGVSLERLSNSEPADNPRNWHSASSLEGFATPGRKNSQYMNSDPVEQGFELEPEVFSPDLDGIEDILFIRYRFRSAGQLARINIFDPRGRLIKVIAGKELLGTEGFFTWDGTDRNGRMVRSGIYLVSVEVSGRDGFQRFRIPCVISQKP